MKGKNLYFAKEDLPMVTEQYLMIEPNSNQRQSNAKLHTLTTLHATLLAPSQMTRW